MGSTSRSEHSWGSVPVAHYTLATEKPSRLRIGMTKFSELSIDTRFEQAQQENGHGIKVDGPTTKLNCVFEATVCISCGRNQPLPAHRLARTKE